MSLLTVKRETRYRRFTGAIEEVEKAWKEQNRDRAEMEKVTNSLLMAIYRLFPLTTETHGLNPLSHFLIFTYPSASFWGKFVTFA